MKEDPLTLAMGWALVAAMVTVCAVLVAVTAKILLAGCL